MSSPKGKVKFHNKLHLLIAKGPVPSRKAWQDAILNYLTKNCAVSNSLLEENKQQRYFNSPLPVNVVPKTYLEDQLRVQEHGETPLTLAVRQNCTADVIAALCRLHPGGTKVADKTGALPLHIAVKHPSIVVSSKKKKKSEISKTISILVAANPVALVSRDGCGRTPLHCLLETHVDTRNVATVEILSRIVEERVWRFEVEAKAQQLEDQNNEKVPMPIPTIVRKKLPKNAHSTANLFTPASAVAIPDSVVGAIPLHYAVKNGLSKDIVSFLIKSYPASVCQIDCNAHTPLHWAFGANERKDLQEGRSGPGPKIPAHHIYRSASVISMLLQRDPSHTYNVATMKDIAKGGVPHRTALHYAVELLAKNIIDPTPIKKGESADARSSCITLKSLKALVDADSEALVTKDALGQTPLHVLFRTIFEFNESEYKKALYIATTGEKPFKAPKKVKIFTPPKVLLELLISGNPPGIANPTTISDIRGLLPLHCAALAVSSPATLSVLVHHNPKALNHLTVTSTDKFTSKYYDLLPSDENPYHVCSFEGCRTPLHMAFANPYTSKSVTDVMIQKLLHYDSAMFRSMMKSDDRDSSTIIDASEVLKIQDSKGDTIMHLAARNHVNVERLSNLLQRDSDSCLSLNNNGDLPLHLLLDEHFLFVNAELAFAHSGSGKNQHDPEPREKIRGLAKKQTVASRLANFKLCGAIFAPSFGWSNNDDKDSNQKDQFEFLKRINLLVMPLIKDEQCLNAASSQHGLLPLHILVAFHAAPYRVISYALKKAPETSEYRSNDGYTALDLHLFRKNIPGEIKKYELDAWRAISQLLFTRSLFPLESLCALNSGGMFKCCNDDDFLKLCEQQIVAEVTKRDDLVYHMKDNHPVEPNHLVFDLMQNFHDDGIEKEEDSFLSEVCLKLWVFMTCYYNPFNPGHNYCDSIKRITADLDYSVIEMLGKVEILSNTFKDIFDAKNLVECPSLAVENYANVFCKQELHSHRYFAGQYSFTPPLNGATILLHYEHDSQTILVQATQNKFVINSPDQSDEKSETTWMFNPATDVRFRSDYTLTKYPVCLKFIKSKTIYDREVNWRTELGDLSGHESITPIIGSFNSTNAGDSARYVKDRHDERFRKLPMHLDSSLSDKDEWIDLVHYPFAIAFPLSMDGNLRNVLKRGLIDSASIKGIAADMGRVLKDMHSKGKIVGNMFFYDNFNWVTHD